MKVKIIRFFSYLAFAVGLTFIVNQKLGLDIDFLEVNDSGSLIIFVGAIFAGLLGLLLTRDKY